jgi:lipoprotein Spr
MCIFAAMNLKNLVVGLIVIVVLGAFTLPAATPSFSGESGTKSSADSLSLDTVPLGYDLIINPICALENEVLDYFEAQGIEITEGFNPKLYGNAYSWIGTPYKYGGSSLSGVDCSSLVKDVFNLAYGDSVRGSSRGLYGQIKAVKQAELQEGDLVFFKIRGNSISHVGLYLRDGYFLHASVSRGVMVNNLSEKYYKKYFFEGGPLQQ